MAVAALPADEVYPAALAWAKQLTATAPLSVAAAKRLLWEGMTASVEEMLRREHTVFGRLGHTPDATEGVKHFLERREPVWHGHVSSQFDRVIG